MKQFYNFEIDKIKNLSTEDKNKRKKNLDLFNKIGFPSKKDEDWKFTDLNSILSKNFTNIVNEELSNVEKKLNLLVNLNITIFLYLMESLYQIIFLMKKKIKFH